MLNMFGQLVIRFDDTVEHGQISGSSLRYASCETFSKTAVTHVSRYVTFVSSQNPAPHSIAWFMIIVPSRNGIIRLIE